MPHPPTRLVDLVLQLLDMSRHAPNPPLITTSRATTQWGLKVRQPQPVNKCQALLHRLLSSSNLLLFHHQTVHHRRTFKTSTTALYPPPTIHSKMSPTSSPAPPEPQPNPPDQPSPTASTPTCVGGGEAVCDPASTHEQQSNPDDGAIQDSILTTSETDAAGEDSGELDNGTGESEWLSMLMWNATDVAYYSRCPRHRPEEAQAQFTRDSFQRKPFNPYYPQPRVIVKPSTERSSTRRPHRDDFKSY